ncbi:MAG TPA: RNA 2',3'-cyclic phosphodiesterase [Candidatus Cloacimonas sp.]|nr:RNA 2',3'-cyclic phosphodiesterase [Candidatus Cloacimonas sp.]HPS61142.1 RNA 2',3'-cyclic phosphodiesterase [Candidatus Cloacimonas sp.]
MIRTFIALELPKPLKSELGSVINKYAKATPPFVNWVKPENLHLTLLFIGDVQPQEIRVIEEVLEKEWEGLSPFSFCAEGLEFFPAINPHLLWLKLSSESDGIFKLNRRLLKELSTRGIEADKKPMKLHITLARLKASLSPALEREIMSSKITSEPLDFDCLCLFKSQLYPEGPQYTILNKYNLNEQPED